MGRGEIPAENTSCKEHLVFQTVSFLAVLGWISDTSKAQHWSYFTVLIFCSIFLSPITGLCIWKKWTEMTFLWKDQLKIPHIPSSPFWMGFSCSVVFGIWVGNTGSWLGRCPNWGLWSPGTRNTCVGTSYPSFWAVTLLRNREGQTKWANTITSLLFSWGGGYIQSKYFVVSDEKGWVNINTLNINILNTMERQIHISLVISVLTFLVSCFMFCDILSMCGVPYVEAVLLTDRWWLAVIWSL